MAVPSGPLNGTDVTVFSGSNEIIAYGTSCTVNITQEPRDRTHKNSGGWRKITEGLRSWTIDIEGLYAWANSSGSVLTNGIDDIFSSYITPDRTSRGELTVKFGTNDSDTGDTYYSGTIWVNSITLSAGTEDNATYSLSGEGDGEITVTVAS